MIQFCPLASGSKGNSIFVQLDDVSFLVDAGISRKQISIRLEKLGKKLSDIDAILVTHDHWDHIAALKLLNTKDSIPIFCNKENAIAINRILDFIPRCKIFTSNVPFIFRGVYIMPFSVLHDSPDPVGFRIEYKNFKLAICTYIGSITNKVQKSLSNLDLLYIEANHDPDLVRNSKSRPESSKRRILSSVGHLSNRDCSILLEKIYHPNLMAVYLAHLSAECNSLDLVDRDVKSKFPSLNFHISEQDLISHISLFKNATIDV